MTAISDWIDRNFFWSASSAVQPPVNPSPPTFNSIAVEKLAWAKLADLREGDKLVVYWDTAKPRNATVARGHLVKPADNLKVGDKITQAQSDAFWAVDGEDAFDTGLKLMDQAGITDMDFMPYIASVCYQLGDAWTKKFPNTWKMICDKQYTQAANALTGTAWDNQTPTRVADFESALRRLAAKVPA